MCLGLVAQTCAPKNFGGLDAHLFVDTEQTFSSNRLAEIAKQVSRNLRQRILQ